ncbi:MAG: hypothetical protein ACLQF0_04690 [Dissulfurispiraceae bacterium]
MKAVERVVGHILSHHEELSNFGRLAVEVYIAYILERVIEHFHVAIGRCFGYLRERISEGWVYVCDDILPGILEKIQKALATLSRTAKYLREKVYDFLHKIARKHQ